MNCDAGARKTEPRKAEAASSQNRAAWGRAGGRSMAASKRADSGRPRMTHRVNGMPSSGTRYSRRHGGLAEVGQRQAPHRHARAEGRGQGQDADGPRPGVPGHELGRRGRPGAGPAPCDRPRATVWLMPSQARFGARAPVAGDRAGAERADADHRAPTPPVGRRPPGTRAISTPTRVAASAMPWARSEASNSSAAKVIVWEMSVPG